MRAGSTLSWYPYYTLRYGTLLARYTAALGLPVLDAAGGVPFRSLSDARVKLAGRGGTGGHGGCLGYTSGWDAARAAAS